MTSRRTGHWWRASAKDHKIDQTSRSRQCKHGARWPTQQWIPRWQAESEVLVPLATERRPGSALGRRPGRRQSHQTIGVSGSHHERWKPSHSLSVSARTIMRGGHCLEVWTKKQQVVSVQRRERTVRGGQSCVTRAGDTRCGEGPGNRVQTNPAPPSVWSTAGDWGKRNTSMCRTCGSKSGRFVTKVGTNVNPADLMTKPLPGPKIEQLKTIMGFEFVEHQP